MSSHIRSLEEAALHTIITLQNLLQVNTIFVTIKDNNTNRVIQSLNRQEVFVSAGDSFPALSPMPTAKPEHITTVTTIPNMMENDITASLPFVAQYGPCSLVCVSTQGPSGKHENAVYAMDRSPLQLTDEQLQSMESMALLFNYMIELENASVTDSLTGLFNRRYLTHLYDNGSDKLYSVMFIDIDDFKDVNDRYGHDTGDLLLQEIAIRLKQNVRKSDVLIRYGGDEFLICFQYLVDNYSLEFIAGKVQDSLKEPFIICDQTITISASLGISSNHGKNLSLKDLISAADHAMYDIKFNVKNK